MVSYNPRTKVITCSNGRTIKALAHVSARKPWLRFAKQMPQYILVGIGGYWIAVTKQQAHEIF